jgi:uncharacterized phage infection (PIP) family protein YhgE
MKILILIGALILFIWGYAFLELQFHKRRLKKKIEKLS